VSTQPEIKSPGALSPELEGHLFSQLSFMNQAGIPLAKSLEFLTEGSPERLGILVNGALRKLESGYNLKIAFAGHGLSPVALALMEMAESGAGLGPSLEMAARIAEETAKFQRRLRAAITYPCFVFSVNIILAVTVLVWLVPLFKNIVGQGPVPLITRLLFQLSDILRSPYAWIVGALLLWEFRKIFLRWKRDEFNMDSLRSFPGLKGLVTEVQRARYWTIFSTLFQVGCDIPHCARLAGEGSGSSTFQRLHLELKKKFLASEPLGDHFTEYNEEYGSLMVGGMALIGEGRASAEFCKSMSTHYEVEVESLVERFHSLLEPLLIGLVATTTGVILLALNMPFAQFIDDLLAM